MILKKAFWAKCSRRTNNLKSVAMLLFLRLGCIMLPGCPFVHLRYPLVRYLNNELPHCYLADNLTRFRYEPKQDQGQSKVKCLNLQ